MADTKGVVKKQQMIQDVKNVRSFKAVASALVLGIAIVAFWRGVWGLMDLYLFPSNPAASYGVSAFAAVIILLSTKNLIKHII